MPEVIPTTCVSCQDSPLSTTASIIGILTFVYALLVGFWFYLKSGAKAIATSPEQFFTILESITKRLQETSVLGIGKIDCGPEQEELLLKTRRFKYQTLVILLQLARWIGSGQLFGKYEDLVERGRMDPGFGLEASDFEDAFPIFEDILFRYMTKTMRYKSVYLSPHWIGWALRFRWNQSPLRRALDEYHKMAQEIEKIRQRQAARAQQDILLQIYEKLEALERRQEEQSTKIGMPRTAGSDTQEEDPLASLMRPRPLRPSPSAISLAIDKPLPDADGENTF